ncbi:MAG: nucleotidyltransferase domain-containing protein [Melioribacteraceae bacterium]|nr:nucleotidyltransferase domain-containing protein [Melioribacteraceae bacterium]MCF8354446.1 nucleotidyltransferase domain-containing protein [Melioribacteraceae bacterium]MCF8394056.1 nucleotidyltransferase domain-containing protein [Melioribacteraceae bacterium]MCF8419822.1 nucleotidyltransferase domain-containing protein [Melioribacteraceae bacterium]
MKNDLKIVKEIKKKLIHDYSGLIEHVIFHGSRLREKKDSDLDLLIIVSKKINWQKESEIFSIIYEFGLKYNIVFDPKFITRNDFENEHKNMPFIQSVRSHGIYA